MSALLVCPECNRKLKIPDSAVGKSVRCPGCQALIPAAKQSTAEREAVTANPAPPPAVVPVRKRPSLGDESADDPALGVRKPVRRRSSLGLILGLVIGGGVLFLCVIGGGVAALV